MEISDKTTNQFRIFAMALGFLFQLIFIYDFPARKTLEQEVPYLCLVEEPTETEQVLCKLILARRACNDGSSKQCWIFQHMREDLGCFNLTIRTLKEVESIVGVCP